LGVRHRVQQQWVIPCTPQYFIQCFYAVGWTTGRASSQYNPASVITKTFCFEDLWGTGLTWRNLQKVWQLNKTQKEQFSMVIYSATVYLVFRKWNYSSIILACLVLSDFRVLKGRWLSFNKILWL